MLKTIFSVLAIVALAAMSAQAASITLDGSLADWSAAGLLLTDVTNDGYSNAHDSTVQCDILRYGSTVVGDTWYAVLEMDRPIADFAYPCVTWSSPFINADQSTSTTLAGTTSYSYKTAELAALLGTDLDVEWGRLGQEGSGTDKDYSYWGSGGSVYGLVAGGVPNGAHAAANDPTSGNAVFEWSDKVANVLAQAWASGSGLTDGDVFGCKTWTVNVGQSANVVGTGPEYNSNGWAQYDWGDDGAGTWGVEVVAVQDGDTDINGITDFDDLNVLLGNYDVTSGMTWADGDCDNNGTVDFDDLNMLLANYDITNGAGVSAGAGLVGGQVPEPSSIVMLATLLAMAGAWIVRQRARA